MSPISSRGNIPGENHDGSRSFLPFRKNAKRKIPKALFARPVGENLEDQPVDAPSSVSSGKETSAASHSDLVRNKRLSLVIALTHSVGFLTPVWVIFGTDHLGLSLLSSLILGSTGWVTSSIFEVPLGAFSDRYGRKISLVTGLGLCAIGDFSLVMYKNFWLLMLFQVVAGLGFAMRSGSLESLLHDTYEASGEKTAYSKLSSLILFLVSISRIATVPVGAWLYTLSPKSDLSSYTFPYIATIFSYCIAISCASLLIEKRSSRENVRAINRNEAGHLFSGLWRQTADSWNEMMANRDVKRVAITLGLYAFIGEGNWALYQPYFREHDLTVGQTSWIYAVLLLLMALGSLYVINIYKKINVMWGMNLMIAMTAINVIFLHLPIFFIVIGFAMSGFIASMSWYLQDNAIQNRMSGDRKTTALSIASMIYNIGAMIGIYGIGAIAEHAGVLNAQWYLVGYGVIVVACLSTWFMRDGFSVREEDALATQLAHRDVPGDTSDEPEAPYDDVPQLKP